MGNLAAKDITNFPVFLLDLSRRIDYTLSENKTQYWSAITSHLSYWNSMDLCRFVLHQIYTDTESNDT
jgi:hypothetical protein